jgi:uncharacterized protein (DUF2267 family)
MQELIQQVAQRTGIPEDKAQVVVDTVVGYLKERLPGPMAAQLDNAVSGQSGEQGGGTMGAAKGLFGGNKQSG